MNLLDFFAGFIIFLLSKAEFSLRSNDCLLLKWTGRKEPAGGALITLLVRDCFCFLTVNDYRLSDLFRFINTQFGSSANFILKVLDLL